MSDIYEQLSENPTLESLRLLIGDNAVVQLSNCLGGRRLYFPKSAGPNSPIAVAIGVENVKKIGNVYGGMHMDIPLVPGKRKQIAQMLESGQPVSKIAATLYTTERTIYRIKAEIKDNRQLSFLD